MRSLADVVSVLSVSGVAEVAGSIHINSTMNFLFSWLHLSFFLPIIFEYFIFPILKNAACMDSTYFVRKMFHGPE
jgi:hypothetical protein